jgi:hypothetical protein
MIIAGKSLAEMEVPANLAKNSQAIRWYELIDSTATLTGLKVLYSKIVGLSS